MAFRIDGSFCVDDCSRSSGSLATDGYSLLTGSLPLYEHTFHLVLLRAMVTSIIWFSIQKWLLGFISSLIGFGYSHNIVLSKVLVTYFAMVLSGLLVTPRKWFSYRRWLLQIVGSLLQIGYFFWWFNFMRMTRKLHGIRYWRLYSEL